MTLEYCRGSDDECEVPCVVLCSAARHRIELNGSNNSSMSQFKLETARPATAKRQKTPSLFMDMEAARQASSSSLRVPHTSDQLTARHYYVWGAFPTGLA